MTYSSSRLRILLVSSLFACFIFYSLRRQVDFSSTRNPWTSTAKSRPGTAAGHDGTPMLDQVPSLVSTVIESTSSASLIPAIQRKPALVAAASNETQTEWMDEVAGQYEIYKYNVHDTSPPTRLRIPANKGHEAMVYLSFIIDNYDALPPHTVFIHGHETSWHQQDDMLPLLRNLRERPLAQAGYISLRCDWYPSCPAEIRPKTHDAVVWGPGVHREDAEMAITEVWSHFFPREELPETIASPCCAQFAVTAKAIRRRKRAEYERMRDWLLETDLEDDISGRVLEKLWAYIMTGKPVYCPPQDLCACKFFGDCSEREWPRPAAEMLEMAAPHMSPVSGESDGSDGLLYT